MPSERLYPIGNVHDFEGNPSIEYEYVTAMVKGGSNGFGLKGGDATTGMLKTVRPHLSPPLAPLPLARSGNSLAVPALAVPLGCEVSGVDPSACWVQLYNGPRPMKYQPMKKQGSVCPSAAPATPRARSAE
jgi:hypothetical protein